MRLRTIELLRGLAALSVAVAHADSLIGGNADLPFGRWHAFAMPGTAGVEFFFVLSGFVMAVAHRQDLRHGGNVGGFLWKRICRIYPMYWFVFAFPLYRFWPAPSVTPGAVAAWLSLLPVRTDTLLVVAWTLRQEVTFYLMLALCLVPRVGRYVLLAWVTAATLRWFVLPPYALPDGVPGVILSHVLSLFDFEFFAGLLAGWLLPRCAGRPGLGSLLLLGGIAGVAWRMSLDGWGVDYGPVYARPIYGAGYGAILLGAATLERAGVFRFGRGTAAVAAIAGAMSYPLYLAHLPVLDWIAAIIGPRGIAAAIGPDLTFVVLLTGSVAAALLLAALVDRPLQRGLRRISAGSRSSRPAPG